MMAMTTSSSISVNPRRRMEGSSPGSGGGEGSDDLIGALRLADPPPAAPGIRRAGCYRWLCPPVHRRLEAEPGAPDRRWSRRVRCVDHRHMAEAPPKAVRTADPT